MEKEVVFSAQNEVNVERGVGVGSDPALALPLEMGEVRSFSRYRMLWPGGPSDSSSREGGTDMEASRTWSAL